MIFQSLLPEITGLAAWRRGGVAAWRRGVSTDRVSPLLPSPPPVPWVDQIALGAPWGGGGGAPWGRFWGQLAVSRSREVAVTCGWSPPAGAVIFLPEMNIFCCQVGADTLCFGDRQTDDRQT